MNEFNPVTPPLQAAPETIYKDRSTGLTIFVLISLALLAGLVLALPAAAAESDKLPSRLLDFSAAKQQQELQLSRELHVALPSEVTNFFQLARQGDYPAMSNIVASCGAQLYAGYSSFTNGKPAWLPFWQPMTEVESAYAAFTQGGTKYPLVFGDDIIQSIPAGSIYFGGTDPGRMLVTALCASQPKGIPFYTLTQNALADGRYLDYLRAMYGRRIYLPTGEDSQKAFQDYTADAQRRMELKQLKPGEDVQVTEGRVQVSGQVAVMAINGLLVKTIFEHNTNCEFYVEESFPLDWMYPYLSPHGLIFKLNRAPLPQLTGAMLDADRAFWAQKCDAMLGGWLKPETSVSNVCVFAAAVYGRKDFVHFAGDREFVTNDYAMKAFSKLRSSQAGLYQWRLTNKPGADRARLRAAADQAFRQAFALCPTSPEAVYRYINFLLSESRFADAVQIAQTALKLAPENEQYAGLLKNLLSFQEQQRMQAKH